MANEMRDRLVELVETAKKEWWEKTGHRQTSKPEADYIADYLIANDVGLFPSTNIENKCGSCIYAKPVVAFGSSRCYVNCTNREHIDRFCHREISTLRQRTHPACKSYKRKEMRG